MKRVCHLTSAHPRYDGRILLKECTSVAAGGYDVTLIVNDDKPDEVSNGVKIVSTGFVPKNRMDRFRNGTKAVYKLALKQDADLYHFHDPELLGVGKKLKRKGKTVIFDAHEDTEEQIRDKKWLPKYLIGIISFLYKCYAKSIIGKLDAIISVSPQLVDKFSGYNSNAVMVTNYPIIEKVEDSVEKSPEYEDIRYICFAGDIDPQWNHEPIIRALEQFDDVRYVLAGKPVTEEYLNHLKSLKGWEKVIFKGRIPFEEVKKIYASAFAGVALNYCAQLKGIGTLGNTKLFECMNFGVPLICTDYLLWKEVVEKNNCGLCIEPTDEKAIENALRFLIEHPDNAKEMGDNGRRIVRSEYNWESQEIELLGLYKSLI